MAASRDETINTLLDAYRALRGDVDTQISERLASRRENLDAIAEDHRIKKEEIIRLEAERDTKPFKERWKYQTEIQTKTKALETVSKQQERIMEDIARLQADLDAFNGLEAELQTLRTSGADLTSAVKKLDDYISRIPNDKKRNEQRAKIGGVILGFVGVTPPLKPDQGLGAIPAGAAKRRPTPTAFVPVRPVVVGRLPVQPGVAAGMGAVGKKLGKLKAHWANMPVDDWGKFFNQTDIDNVKEQVKDKPIVTLQDVPLEPFRDSFKSIPDTLKSYSATAAKTFHVKPKNDQQYTVFKGIDETNPIMEISRVPAEELSGTNPGKPSVVNITLTDKSDHSLYLAVVAAKDLLERAGSESKRFFIENCANDPEKAVKLFIIGKSLGLNPIFRDKPGATSTIEESIERATDWTLRLQGDAKELPLWEVYKLAKNCATADKAKELIEKLESKQPPALVANPVAFPLRVPKGAVALAGLVATAPPLAPVAAPAPPPPPPPAAEGGRSAPLTLAEQLAARARGLKKPRPPGLPR